MSAWAEQPGGGSPAGARPRPASALPLQRPCASQADDAGCSPELEKLFWTPPKAWMLACMDKGMPLGKKKTHASAGGIVSHHNGMLQESNNKHRSAKTPCECAVVGLLTIVFACGLTLGVPALIHKQHSMLYARMRAMSL